MERWIKYDKSVIFRNHKAEFLKDYALYFGNNNLCASCPSKLDSYYNDFNRVFIMKLPFGDRRFIVKKKYNGLPLEFGSNIILSNANMTKDLAITFITKHSKGKNLFEKLPENIDELINESSSDQNTELQTLISELTEEFKDLKTGDLKTMFSPLTAKSKEKLIEKIAIKKLNETNQE